jgi:CheY-like chemotaxis protein
MRSPKICMLVDDDLDDHEIFSLALQEAEKDIEIVRAYDGVDALSQLRNTDFQLPDFIFLDLNLPRMNGMQCLEELKLDDMLRNIPVVIYSTSSEIGDLLDAQRLGAAAFIVKSTSIQELIMALRHFFGDN